VIVALIDNAFLSIIAAAIPASTVIVLCATGVMLNERVGVLNLGQEGLIGIGAVFAVIARHLASRARGSPYWSACSALPY